MTIFLDNSQTNDLNKAIASFQKCENDFFRDFLSFWNQMGKKKQTKKFTTGLSVLWVLECFQQQRRL